mmetsp:Transcript_1128/g.3967  ORF Transcript_1128/g.3967 Transcript_1128/m.3967 type:complete len:298 (-) Transcript_1128:1725-2618(-)
MAAAVALALLQCTGLGVFYVGLLYVWRHPEHQDRGHPSTVRRRLVSVCVATLLSLAWVRMSSCPPLRASCGASGQRSDVHWCCGSSLGSTLAALWVAASRTVALFLGPTLQLLLKLWLSADGHFRRQHSKPLPWSETLSALSKVLRQGCLPDWNVYSLRNLVLAPLCEEIVFRLCICRILQAAGLSNLAVVLLSPLFFGAAHLHTLRQRLRDGDNAQAAFAEVGLQFSYTTVFGWLAAVLYLSTGNVASSFLSHSLANMYGFPNFPALLDEATEHRAALVVAYVSGIYLFWKLLPSV